MSTYERPAIALAGTSAMIEAALAEAAQIGIAVSIAIVDESGVLKAFARCDNAGVSTVQVSIDKAYAAVGIGAPTMVWSEMIADNVRLAAGLGGIDRFVMLGGGIPLMADGRIAGGVGVSGAHQESQDIAIAQAAVAVFEAGLGTVAT
jgi:uncharacterized protein GlcG (DUF336 family)